MAYFNKIGHLLWRIPSENFQSLKKSSVFHLLVQLYNQMATSWYLFIHREVLTLPLLKMLHKFRFATEEDMFDWCWKLF